MAKRGAGAVGGEADFAWPPPDDELSGYDADPPTEPIDLDALPIRRTASAAAALPPTRPTPPTPPTPPASSLASAEPTAPPDGVAGELEWPPTPESLASMAVISVETGREHVLDPTTGSLLVVPRTRDTTVSGVAGAAPGGRPHAGHDVSPRTAAGQEPPTGVRLAAGSIAGGMPVGGAALAAGAPRRGPAGSASPAPPRPGVHGRRAHVVLAGLALVALVAPPTAAIWRLTLLPELPAVRPPAAFAGPTAGEGDGGRGPRARGPADQTSADRASGQRAAEGAGPPHESAGGDGSPTAPSPPGAPPADPGPGARDLPQAESTVPMGEPLPVPAPPPAPSVPSPRP